MFRSQILSPQYSYCQLRIRDYVMMYNKKLLIILLVMLLALTSTAMAEVENSDATPDTEIGKIVLWPLEHVGNAKASDAFVIYNALFQYINKDNQRKALSILHNSGENSAPIEDYDKADCKAGRKYQCAFAHARKFGADTVVTGQLTLVGNVWIVALERIEVESRITKSSVNRMAEGELDKVLPILSELIEDLFKGYEVPKEEPPALVATAPVTTPEPERTKEPVAVQQPAEVADEEQLQQWFEGEEPEPADDEYEEGALLEEKDEDYDDEPKRLRTDLTLIMPTAQPMKVGRWALDSQYLGLIDFTFQINDSLNLGIQTNLPVGVLALMPHITYSIKINEKAWFGLNAQVGFLIPMGLWNDSFIFAIMGGPLFTYGTDRWSFNIGMRFAGASIGSNFLDGALLLVNIAGAYQFTDMVGFGVDMTIPFLLEKGGDSELSDFVAILAYGLNLQGSIAYGTIGFAAVLNKSYINSPLMTFMPLGIPYFRFGFIFD